MSGSGLSLRYSLYQPVAGLLLSIATPFAASGLAEMKEKADPSRAVVCIHAGARPETDIVRTTGWILTTHSCLERNPSPFLDVGSGFAPFFRRRHTKVADFHLS